MAPLLASIVGALAPVAIVGIVPLAYAIGHVIRCNILYVEPRLADGRLHGGIRAFRAVIVLATAALQHIDTLVMTGFQKICYENTKS